VGSSRETIPDSRAAEPRRERELRHRGGVTWTAFGLAILLAVLLIIVV
jgi:hypothetical protein